MPDDFNVLSIAPAAEDLRGVWLDSLKAWRAAERDRLLYDGKNYAAAKTIWTRRAFVCGIVMLWEEAFFDAASQTFLVEDYLDEAARDFGGYDALILWHAYPRIGFDERNQFDFYRDIPGGLAALTDVVRRLHARGVKAIIDYNPWDTATRRETLDDGASLAALVAEIGADGIFLDTLPSASAALRHAFEAHGLDIALQSEDIVPLDAVHDHLISWVQWPQQLAERLVLRNKWFEPRQMQNVVRRWHRDHRDELHTAWLNGTGIVFWENIFGSWNPWNADDKRLLALMRPIQLAMSDVFADGDWTPFVPTGHEGIDASRWDHNGDSLWTLVNRTSEPITHLIGAICGERPVIDLLSGTRLDPAAWITIDARGIGCLYQSADRQQFAPPLPILEPRTQSQRPEALKPEAQRPDLVHHARGRLLDQAIARTPDSPSPVLVVEPGDYRLAARFRLRECGDYGPANLIDVAYPDFSREVVVERRITTGRLAVDLRPVSNARFGLFLKSSGYAPADSSRFLARWRDGAPVPGEEDWPVTFVDLGDARAFTAWYGGRLPTEDEWQVALTGQPTAYGARRVWEWTESEQSDGHTRFAILKGGSDLKLDSSSWYAESGPLSSERSAKFILFAPGIDRCRRSDFAVSGR